MRNPKPVEIHELDALLAARAKKERAYMSFLDRSTMHMGVYHLPKSELDRQIPHEEDEVYYVLSGKAMIEVDGEKQVAKTGSVIFVAAKAEHRFIEIEDDLDLLVFFSKADVGEVL